VFISQNFKKPNSRKETLPADRIAPAFRLILQREKAAAVTPVPGFVFL